tara:strand:+ start:1562 stop:2155 length:594 start_codon:yes stop_codon:yes gene_type:complete
MKNYTEEEKEMINGVLRSYTEDYWRSSSKYVNIALNDCIEHFQEANGLTPRPKLEIGKWYKSEMGSLFSPNSNLVTGYGFSWMDKSWHQSISINKGYTPVTNEEVTAALNKEAEKRGFVQGATIGKDMISEPFDGLTLDLHDVSHPEWEVDGEGVFNLGDKCIMKDGVWTTIVKTTTKMSVAQLEAAHGYTNLEITK